MKKKVREKIVKLAHNETAKRKILFFDMMGIQILLLVTLIITMLPSKTLMGIIYYTYMFVYIINSSIWQIIKQSEDTIKNNKLINIVLSGWRVIFRSVYFCILNPIGLILCTVMQKGISQLLIVTICTGLMSIVISILISDKFKSKLLK